MDKKRGDDPVYLLYLRDKSRECWYSGQGRWTTEDFGCNFRSSLKSNWLCWTRGRPQKALMLPAKRQQFGHEVLY